MTSTVHSSRETTPAATHLETAADIAAAVRRGEVSPRAMAERSLARIDTRDDDLRAFALVRRDEVLAEADALANHPRLAELPLAGVPIAIKDSVDVIGTPTRQGSEATSAEAVSSEAPPVTRLREAGALIIGKTATPEMCISAVTHSKLSGVTRNPWDLTKSPGGSSGGSAAAVAAGMVAVALGTDGGGSVRLPSASCGLVGFKSARGAITGVDEEAGWFGVTQWGPLATTVLDAALFFDALSSQHLASGLKTDAASEVRVGLCQTAPAGVSVHHSTTETLQGAADALAEAGHHLSPAEIPSEALDTLRALRRAGSGLARDVRNDVSFRELGVIAKALAVFGTAARFRGDPEIADLDTVAERMGEAFADHDVLLSPTSAGRPLPADMGYDDAKLALLWAQKSATAYTAIWNLAGFPAISVPGPVAEDGLPTAVQLIATPGNEPTLFALAQQLEAHNGWQYPSDYP